MALVGDVESSIWRRSGRQQPWRLLRGDAIPIRSVCFSPSGDEMILARTRDVECWSLTDRGGGPSLRWARNVSPDLYGHVAISTDGEDVVAFVLDKSNESTIVTTPSLQRLDRSGSGHRVIREIQETTSCCFSPDGSWFAGIDGYTVVLEPLRLGGHSCRLEPADRKPLTALAFSPDGHTLAVAAQDGKVRLWPWRRLLDA
jgi:WD40 repeat protein